MHKEKNKSRKTIIQNMKLLDDWNYKMQIEDFIPCFIELVKEQLPIIIKQQEEMSKVKITIY
jgi:hypothetical protein